MLQGFAHQFEGLQVLKRSTRVLRHVEHRAIRELCIGRGCGKGERAFTAKSIRLQKR